MKYKTITLVVVIVAAMLTTAALVVQHQINKANDIMDKGQQIISEKKYTTPELDPTVNKEMYDKSLQVKKWSNDMVQYMHDLKKEMIRLAEGPDTDAIDGDKIILANVKHRDDYDTPTKFMVGDGTKKGKAYLLHTKFNQYHASLLSIMNPKDTLAYTDSLDSEIDNRSYSDPEDPEIDGWEKHIFYHTPLAAAIAHLSKLQADIRHDESVIINYYFMKSK